MEIRENNRTFEMEKCHYERLLANLGVGNFKEADIAVFGIEGGTGSQSVEANVMAHYKYFGRDNNGNDVHCIDKNDWRKGYWEPSCQSHREKVMRVVNEIGEEGRYENLGGPFLKLISRMSLAVENSNDKDIGDWFKRMGNNREVDKEINKFILNGLFCERDGVQTALTDWRPLPRPNMKVWPEEYSEIDKNKYLRAVNLKSKNTIEDSFTNYSEDVNQRMNLIKSLFETYKTPILLGIGGIPEKERLIKKIFKDCEFEKMYFESYEGYCGLKTEVHFKENKMTIFLIPFPAGFAPIFNGRDMFKYFEEFTGKYLLPTYKESKK